MKKALITGIAGQDGSYLTELLLNKGYEVHGIDILSIDKLKQSNNLKDKINNISFYSNSLTDYNSILDIIKQIRPDECYNFAATSFVDYNFENEFNTNNNNINSTHYLLAAIKQQSPLCRLFFAASSEIFGNPLYSPQDENTQRNPRSIYGISKSTGFDLVKYYREHHGLFACSGILYNHESPRRGSSFVTKKIITTAVKIKLGMETKLVLGDIDACRDWGYAPDYVSAMHLLLQANEPDDYIIATGETHSVREFVETAFSYLGLDYRQYMEIDKNLLRPAEKSLLVGNPQKIVNKLGWKPTKSFNEIIKEMIDYEMALHKSKRA